MRVERSETQVENATFCYCHIDTQVLPPIAWKITRHAQDSTNDALSIVEVAAGPVKQTMTEQGMLF